MSDPAVNQPSSHDAVDDGEKTTRAEDEAVTFAQEQLAVYHQLFNEHFSRLMCAKLGLGVSKDASALLDSGLELLRTQRIDYTAFFFQLSDAVSEGDGAVMGLVTDEGSEALAVWLAQWRRCLSDETRSLEEIATTMRATNPVNIPRLDAVENALDQAKAGDMQGYEALLAALQSPFEKRKEWQEFSSAGPPSVRRTFCET